MSAAIKSGTYYITNQYTGTVFTFADSPDGTNLTAWQFVSSVDQRWNVTDINGQYTFKNIVTEKYISLAGRISSSVVGSLYANATPYPWLIQSCNGGYLIAALPDALSGNVANLRGGSYSNDTNIIMWPFTLEQGPNNAIWYFNETTPNGDTPTTARRSHSGAIAGGVIGGLVLCVGLLLLAFFLYRRTAQNKSHTWASAPGGTITTDQMPFNPTSFDLSPIVPVSAPLAPEIMELPMSVTRSQMPRLSQPQDPVFAGMTSNDGLIMSSGGASRLSASWPSDHMDLKGPRQSAKG